jgi:hypothetical protein
VCACGPLTDRRFDRSLRLILTPPKRARTHAHPHARAAPASPPPKKNAAAAPPGRLDRGPVVTVRAGPVSAGNRFRVSERRTLVVGGPGRAGGRGSGRAGRAGRSLEGELLARDGAGEQLVVRLRGLVDHLYIYICIYIYILLVVRLRGLVDHLPRELSLSHSLTSSPSLPPSLRACCVRACVKESACASPPGVETGSTIATPGSANCSSSAPPEVEPGGGWSRRGPCTCSS